ncbi:hypothetical protein [Nocardia sp. NPDC057030]|uniref:hypothetical protein n=1 Tax=unclassified Nocardia TaxID=2637762 RepID=UPI0036257A71
MVGLAAVCIATGFGTPLAATARGAAQTPAWGEHCTGNQLPDSVGRAERDSVVQSCQRTYSAAARSAVTGKYIVEYLDGEVSAVPKDFAAYSLEVVNTGKADKAGNASEAAAAAEAAAADAAKMAAKARDFANDPDNDSAKVRNARNGIETVSAAAEDAAAKAKAAAEAPTDLTALNAAADAENEAADAVVTAFKGPELDTIAPVQTKTNEPNPEVEEAKHSRQALRVYYMVCWEPDGGLAPFSDDWYSKWRTIEEHTIWDTENSKYAAQAARKAVFDDGAWNPDTRQRYCGETKKYADWLKLHANEFKGTLLDAYTTEKGLGYFFATKLNCQEAITKQEYKAQPDGDLLPQLAQYLVQKGTLLEDEKASWAAEVTVPAECSSTQTWRPPGA